MLPHPWALAMNVSEALQVWGLQAMCKSANMLSEIVENVHKFLKPFCNASILQYNPVFGLDGDSERQNYDMSLVPSSGRGSSGTFSCV